MPNTSLKDSDTAMAEPNPVTNQSNEALMKIDAPKPPHNSLQNPANSEIQQMLAMARTARKIAGIV
jgi:hypothetical protein